MAKETGLEIGEFAKFGGVEAIDDAFVEEKRPKRELTVGAPVGAKDV